MKSFPPRFSLRRKGAILLNVLIVVVITSILLAGLSTLVVSDSSMTTTESNYANSLVTAEAGINYELRKISTDDTTADQKHSSGVPGTSYTTAAGTFQIYITQRNADGTEPTPWTAGKNLWIYSTGSVSGVSRTVKVAAIAYTSTPTDYYGVYGVTGGVMNGSAATVTGNVGTNGLFNFNGQPTINGSIVFNGSAAGWQSPQSGYTVVTNPNPVIWPTVEAIALQTFGAQGLSFVAAYNDNGLASPPIVNKTVSTNGNGSQTFVGKAGGANYYLTSLSCGGNSKLIFNNASGPITIWVGPSGGSGTFSLKGGAAAVKSSPASPNAVRVYAATNSDVLLNGNSELDAGIYHVNNSGVGQVAFSGTPDIHGSVIANSFTFNGNPTVTAIQGYFSPNATVTYYGFVPPWLEVGGVN